MSNSQKQSNKKAVSVELKNVVKQFPDPSGGVVTAVDDVTLQIYDGEFFSLLGPSGCGKTTTLRMIAGLELPSSGSVLIHGQEMAQEPAYRRPVNTVFQRYALFPHMTVYDNVAFGLRMKQVAKDEVRQRVDDVLKLVRLDAMGQRKPGQLSGGQQQRVALARALVNNPEVLLLDEPLGALDLKLRQAMQDELKRIQQTVGITFIYVTHDQEEALTMSDRIAVMNDGRVLQVDTPYELYEDPESRFVANFIGETNFLTGKTDRVAGSLVYVRLDNGAMTTIETGNSAIGESVKAGAAVTVAIRPEKIYLGRGDAPAEADNAYAGKVENIVYIGTDTYYDMDLPGQTNVTVRQQNQDYTGSANTLAVGDVGYVAWRAHNASLLLE
ncbi:MAG: ABC transporter ATP-binding protein [Caldilineaceae bacterium]|nr:ABC transporter ATP-binding protein [Caldilineaceae bacterium]MCB9157138.1 ABC transporter ATP-binding protein [Caldilineaceae bacterium]